ncbi:MAG TPA: hypothetical protein VNS29_04360 [Burkholderiaceae bacterium]|nr:hypothetical protein [Burkholderiaceae bacterium]
MLTYRDLRAIQDGNRRNPDVMELLREVKRLRDLTALTYSVLGFIPLGGLSAESREALRPVLDALNAEPAVDEYRKMRAKREEMEFRRKTAMEASDVRTSKAGQ